MPMLAGLMLGLFTGLADFFTKYLSKKLAFGAAAVSTFALLTTGLYTALSLSFQTLLNAFPPADSITLTLVWMAVPDITPVAISACIGADTAIALYRWNCENLKLVNYIT